MYYVCMYNSIFLYITALSASPSAASLCSSSSLSVLCGRPIWRTWFWPSLLDLHNSARFVPGVADQHKVQQLVELTIVVITTPQIPWRTAPYATHMPLFICNIWTHVHMRKAAIVSCLKNKKKNITSCVLYPQLCPHAPHCLYIKLWVTWP